MSCHERWTEVGIMKRSVICLLVIFPANMMEHLQSYIALNGPHFIALRLQLHRQKTRGGQREIMHYKQRMLIEDAKKCVLMF